MPHPTTARINADIQRHMTGDELAELGAHLYPEDCQLCGKPLGNRAPSLVVVAHDPEWGTAMLTHTRCSPPAWHEGFAMMSTAGSTWRTTGAAIPAELDGSEPPDMLAVFLLNPAMESVSISRESGRWRVDTAVGEYPFAPLQDLSVTPVGTNRITNARLRVDRPRVWVGPPEQPELYVVDIYDERWWSMLEAKGGALLVITHAIDPRDGRFGAAELVAMRRPGEALAGWIPLERKH